MVWLFSRMQSQMCLQITLFVESFLAIFKGADEIAIPIVLFQMNFQALLSTVRFVTTLDGADKVFLHLVRLGVVA